MQSQGIKYHSKSVIKDTFPIQFLSKRCKGQEDASKFATRKSRAPRSGKASSLASALVQMACRDSRAARRASWCSARRLAARCFLVFEYLTGPFIRSPESVGSGEVVSLFSTIISKANPGVWEACQLFYPASEVRLTIYRDASASHRACLCSTCRFFSQT